ncbi:hypothetical protein QGN29_06510 [Temperatibacter marinus]|uniref:Uncharacterized protein n=1 Tax=Temperatibacter marinus TaxID=1456591 RepID=A0AA52HA99_9PROT|nr:hypothetical protein [Temperatibacter marinus]WND04026.1 hypothetical protein QGN29_06510 [Temperatibacter marinus]
MVWEIISTAILVALTSFGLHFWAYRKGVEEVNGRIQRPSKKNEETGEKRSKKERQTGNTVIDKWLGFGGGFYGTVAFMKFAQIELTQFFGFISDLDGMIAYFKNFGIHSIIAFFIDQFQNFISAVIWPVGYLGSYNWLELGVLFGAAYFAYLGAKNLAKSYVLQAQTESLRNEI